MKKILLFSVFIFLIVFVNASNETANFNLSVNDSDMMDKKEIICKEVYYFIIKKLDSEGNINYSDLDLINLGDSIERKAQINLDEEKISEFVTDYEELCKNITNSIPRGEKTFEKLEFVTEENNIDLDTHGLFQGKIPLPEMNIGETTRKKLRLKYLFGLVDKEGWLYIDGIKTFSIFLLIAFVVLIYFSFSNSTINKAIKQLTQ